MTQVNGNGHRSQTVPVPDAGARAPSRRVHGLVAAIPAHNEEVGIGSVVLRALEHVDEVVVVDDGSTDATARVAERAGARVIRHGTNGGYGEALRTIFRTAKEEDWPALVILDSDGQHNPEDVPAVAGPVLDGTADVTIGSRFIGEGAAEGIPAYRQLGIRVLTGLNNVGARDDQRVTDGQCGFRAYSRRAIAAIAPSDHDMGISAEILFQARKAGLTFHEVPIKVRYDVDGSSQNPVKHGMGVIRSMARYAEVEHPLLCFWTPGLLLFLAGLALAARAAALYLADGAVAVGSAVAGAGLVLLGLMAAVTGLVLHAVVTATKSRGGAA